MTIIYVIIFIIMVLTICVLYVLFKKHPKSYIGGNDEKWYLDKLNKDAIAAILLYSKLVIMPSIKSDTFMSDLSLCLNNYGNNRLLYLKRIDHHMKTSLLAETDAGCSYSLKRAEYRVNDILRHVKLSGPILDIGCGDGSITNELHKRLNTKCSVCVEYDLPKSDFPKHIKRTTSINKLTNNKFNTVLALMSLHHIEKLDSMLLEISKKIKTGGIFVIREHDFDLCVKLRGKSSKQYLDWMHILYDLAEGFNISDLGNASKYIRPNYNSSKFWINKIESYGFKYLNTTKSRENKNCSTYLIFKKNKI